MNQARFHAQPTPALVVQGTGARPARAILDGARARVAGTITGGGKTWRVVIPLHASRWSGPVLPLPSGEYVLTIEHADGTVESGWEPVALTKLGTLRASLDGDRVTVGPPLDPAYDSWEGQAALERRYATRPTDVLENAVFFESFYGRNVGDNPLAIDRELARRAPGVTRYWSVIDLSVPVPDGAVPIVEGTPDWWRVRGAARLLVVNDWLRRRFERRRGQHVIQTWHGTPLKRLALQRPGFDPRRALAVIREARRWDVLLAQNPYGARILRRAYAFGRKPLWVEGYPRNDVLAAGDASRAGAAVRRLLGVGAHERVLLYAPTWRDDREQIVQFLELEALAADTGAVVLVRGHSRTLLPGRDAAGSRVIDVTAFGDTAQLMLAADALITDYSSVMFDFSVTGKPMYFFVPDMEHYRGQLRGFYFDLAARAPGPVVRTQEELTAAIVRDDPVPYADKYATWRQTFNAREDGHAAERVVARILDQGLIER
ncbi:CDP-glycerol glycerophosphotransferase family protein [Microbacterium sp.]|uniref:CDP-glycerol glycerophosphotransferase family protein n=1 Tax=Microbacterium sp. TaxID=51671 RepID=UPI003A926C65